MNDNFFEHIQEFAQTSTGTQKRVCQVVLEHAQDVAFMTVDDMASKAGVSAASVSRTAQAMGFKGYPEMQEQIRRIVRNRIAPPSRFAWASKKGFDYEASLRLDADNLSRLLACNPPENIAQTARQLIEAPAVFFMGMRSSYTMAFFMTLNLRQIRSNVHLVQPSAGLQPDTIHHMNPGDMFVMVSLPRHHRETLFMGKEAKQAGCLMTAITDSHFSPVARIADTCLLVPYASLSFFNSYVAAFALANLLLAEAALVDERQSTASLAALNGIHTRCQTFTDD